MAAAVVIGGGHGLGASIEALIESSYSVTAIVGVQDDGGSTGKLRRLDPSLPAIGDLRLTLSRLISRRDPSIAEALEYRFLMGPLANHPLGNLALTALFYKEGSLKSALAELARWFGVEATVLPASECALNLIGVDNTGRRITGQLNLHNTTGITKVWLEPEVVPDPAVEKAIMASDLVVLGPGSLFTSVIATAITPGVREALEATPARIVFIANLHQQPQETLGLGLNQHLDALSRHEIRFDQVIADPRYLNGSRDERIIWAPVADATGTRHDSSALSACFGAIAGMN
jgi:uncharacterized cofD-like protein